MGYPASPRIGLFVGPPPQLGQLSVRWLTLCNKGLQCVEGRIRLSWY